MTDKVRQLLGVAAKKLAIFLSISALVLGQTPAFASAGVKYCDADGNHHRIESMTGGDIVAKDEQDDEPESYVIKNENNKFFTVEDEDEIGIYGASNIWVNISTSISHIGINDSTVKLAIQNEVQIEWLDVTGDSSVDIYSASTDETAEKCKKEDYSANIKFVTITNNGGTINANGLEIEVVGDAIDDDSEGNAISNNGGTININNTSLKVRGKNLFSNGDGSGDPEAKPGTITINSGTVSGEPINNMHGQSVINLNGGKIDSVNNQKGTTTINGGKVTGDVTVSGGTVNISSEDAVAGDVTVSGGTVTISSEDAVAGDIKINGGKVDIESSSIGGDIINNGGTLKIEESEINNIQSSGGSTTIDGSTVNGNVSNTGTSMEINNSKVGSENSKSNIANSSQLSIGGTSEIYAGSIENDGEMQIGGNSEVNADTIDNKSGAKIEVNGESQVVADIINNKSDEGIEINGNSKVEANALNDYNGTVKPENPSNLQANNMGYLTFKIDENINVSHGVDQIVDGQNVLLKDGDTYNFDIPFNNSENGPDDGWILFVYIDGNRVYPSQGTANEYEIEAIATQEIIIKVEKKPQEYKILEITNSKPWTGNDIYITTEIPKRFFDGEKDDSLKISGAKISPLDYSLTFTNDDEVVIYITGSILENLKLVDGKHKIELSLRNTYTAAQVIEVKKPTPPKPDAPSNPTNPDSPTNPDKPTDSDTPSKPEKPENKPSIKPEPTPIIPSTTAPIVTAKPATTAETIIATSAPLVNQPVSTTPSGKTETETESVNGDSVTTEDHAKETKWEFNIIYIIAAYVLGFCTRLVVYKESKKDGKK